LLKVPAVEERSRRAAVEEPVKLSPGLWLSLRVRPLTSLWVLVEELVEAAVTAEVGERMVSRVVELAATARTPAMAAVATTGAGALVAAVRGQALQTVRVLSGT